MPDLPLARPPALRKNQHRVAVVEYFADVRNRLPCTGFALRQGERVEEERRQVVIRGVLETLAEWVAIGKEMRLEELLGHRWREAVAMAIGQGQEHNRRVHVALMVR